MFPHDVQASILISLESVVTFLLPSVEEDYLSEGILIKINTMK